MGEIKRLRLPERLYLTDWRNLAWDVFQYQYFDAVVIHAPTHLIPYLGTSLAMMLKNFHRPVVFYGEDWQEEQAAQWARHCANGIYALGTGGLYLACRTSFLPERGIFSPYEAPVGVIENGVYCFYRNRVPRQSSDPPMVCDAVNEKIGMVLPGYMFAKLGALLEKDAYFVMLDGSRSSIDWLFTDKRDMLNRLRRAQIPVLVHGLPPVVRDPELRRMILRSGVILTGDMTREAALVKLMWTMARTGAPEGVRLYFSLNFAGETSQEQPPLVAR